MKRTTIYLFFACVLTLSLATCKKKDDSLQRESIETLSSQLRVNVDSMLLIEGMYIGNINRLTPMDSTLYRLVDYTDFDDCPPCKIDELYGWKELWDRADSMGVSLSFFHIFAIPSPQDNPLIVKTKLMAEDLEHPIFIDSLGIFRKLNADVLSNTRFRTFLINRKGDILMVGNPRRNKEIEKLLWGKNIPIYSN